MSRGLSHRTLTGRLTAVICTLLIRKEEANLAVDRSGLFFHYGCEDQKCGATRATGCPFPVRTRWVWPLAWGGVARFRHF